MVVVVQLSSDWLSPLGPCKLPVNGQTERLHAKAHRDGQRGYFGGSWVSVADSEGCSGCTLGLKGHKNSRKLLSFLRQSSLLFTLNPQIRPFVGERSSVKTGRGSGSMRSDWGSWCSH